MDTCHVVLCVYSIFSVIKNHNHDYYYKEHLHHFNILCTPYNKRTDIVHICMSRSLESTVLLREGEKSMEILVYSGEIESNTQ